MSHLGSILLIDMDGCLCDFEGHGFKIWGVSYTDKSWAHDHKQEIRRADVAKHPNFWEDLDYMDEGRQLWEYAKPYSPHILSAYAEWDPRSIPGKLHWIEKHLGRLPRSRIHLVKRSAKADYAMNLHTGKPNVLVDDYERNIKEFRQAGGIGVHHVGARSSILKLQELGFRKD